MKAVTAPPDDRRVKHPQPGGRQPAQDLAVVDLGIAAAPASDAGIGAAAVRFNRNGTKPPLILVRTWRTEVPKHRLLARHLGPDRPVYSIAHPDGNTADSFPDTVEAWAGFCLPRFDSLDLAGPHYLGGWSMGGVIALGLAEKLAERGEQIGLVALIDARMPKPRPKRGAHLTKFANKAHRVLDRLTEFSALPSSERRAYVMDRVRYRTARYGRRWTRRLTGRGRRPRRRQPRRNIGTLRRAVWVAYLKYRPPPSTLPVAQLWTEDSRDATGDISLGWSLFLHGALYTEAVPGNHESMFAEPNVAGMASRLDELLDHAANRSA